MTSLQWKSYKDVNHITVLKKTADVRRERLYTDVQRFGLSASGLFVSPTQLQQHMKSILSLSASLSTYTRPSRLSSRLSPSATRTHPSSQIPVGSKSLRPSLDKRSMTSQEALWNTVRSDFTLTCGVHASSTACFH